MLARRALPKLYAEWNERCGAPFGHPEGRNRPFEERLGDPEPRRFGPFGFAWASTTRVYEYPWAYEMGEFKPGMRVLEVGGGLAGMQFLLAQEGCQVVNVDRAADYSQQGGPPMPGFNWWVSRERHDAINKALGTDVTLLADSLEDADLARESFDRALCVSVLEHMSPQAARSVVERIRDLLVPGGKLVLTVALFLDLVPFGVRDSNHWGRNLDVYSLTKDTGLRMTAGDRSELLGFPEFDFDGVVTKLPDLFVGFYPCMAELLILEKPA